MFPNKVSPLNTTQIMKAILLFLLMLITTVQAETPINPPEETQRAALRFLKVLKKPSSTQTTQEYSVHFDSGGQITIQAVVKTPDGRQITANHRFGGLVNSLVFIIVEKNGDTTQVGDCTLSGRADIGDVFQKNGLSVKTYLMFDGDDVNAVGIEHAESYQKLYQKCIEDFTEALKNPRPRSNPSDII